MVSPLMVIVTRGLIKSLPVLPTVLLEVLALLPLNIIFSPAASAEGGPLTTVSTSKYISCGSVGS